jgi:hypothetical protein
MEADKWMQFQEGQDATEKEAGKPKRREKCPIERRRPHGISGEERFLLFSAIPAPAALQDAVTGIATGGSSFTQRFVAVPPPFTHDENGKNNDEREAQGDESSIGGS